MTVTPENYTETTRDRLNRNWNRLEILCNDFLLTRLSDKDLHSSYSRMLNDLRQDRVIDGKTALGMFRAPASKDRHHNREGGLVAHLLEMWDIWWKLGPMLSTMCTLHPLMTQQNVWRAILHHDLNKVWRYIVVSGAPDDSNLWQVMYSKRDMAAEMLGNTNKSLWFLQKYGIELTLPLYNALLVSEGGYSAMRPNVETAFAKLIYVLDELSSGVVDRLVTDRFWDSKELGFNEEV